ncbi:MAG: nickel pincer cofactor biosynthesis protein LarB [Deltaproteobacteria bacterium]|jgi:NCAIR mutase (PurE)-related protein|nr:nickel pincer cofactor biosynthesis protein LarB [Deltaproteobacteria bacterium]
MIAETPPGVLFDHGRQERIGLPEAVFCLGKPWPILLSLLEQFQNQPVLFTRLENAVFQKVPLDLRQKYDYDPISRTAFALTQTDQGHGDALSVAVVSAGSSDAPVAREASRTLLFLGYRYALYEDTGVAGLWRLTDQLRAINERAVIIVVAGLDAALASVLGGLTSLPVIAVPTSVGYGLARGGESALSSMLLSCAPGVTVMNIDNGYGAACAAARILRLLSRNLKRAPAENTATS